jgi:hypothetical protein
MQMMRVERQKPFFPVLRIPRGDTFFACPVSITNVITLAYFLEVYPPLTISAATSVVKED